MAKCGGGKKNEEKKADVSQKVKNQKKALTP